MGIDRKANNQSKKVMMKDMTELEILFCQKYIANQGNLSKTAEACGLARPTCYKYLAKEGVKQYLEILTSIGTKGEDIASTDELLTILSAIAKGTVKDEILNMKTGEIVEILPSAISRTGAINTILRQRGELSGLQLTQNNIYCQLPPSAKDLTQMIESKTVTKVPIDVEYLDLDGDENE